MSNDLDELGVPSSTRKLQTNPNEEATDHVNACSRCSTIVDFGVVIVIRCRDKNGFNHSNTRANGDSGNKHKD